MESKDFTYFKGNTHTLPSYTNTKWGATICLQQTQRSEHTNTDQCKFRSSSVVLMLAEAYAEIGNEAMSKQVLNQLLAARTREGASLLTCDNYKIRFSFERFNQTSMAYRNVGGRWNRVL